MATIAGSVERTLRLLDQRVVVMPDGTDRITFVLYRTEHQQAIAVHGGRRN